MPTVLFRSVVIGLIVGAFAQLALDLLFAQAAVPWPSYNAEQAAKMSGTDAAAYTHANSRTLSGVAFLAYSLREPALLAGKLKTFGLLSAAVCVGCFLFALWSSRSAG